MKRIRRRLLLVVFAALALLAAAVGFFSYQVRQVPEFYQQAIAAPVVEQQQAAEQFEHSALELQNSIRRDEDWQVEIAADEVNGWLATALPQKFPGVLPPEVSEPRVAIAPDRLHIATKYHTSGITTVVSIQLSAFLTPEPNVVAVRIHRVAAGNIPLPLGKYLEQITAEAARHGIYIRWQEIEGDPQAIVTLPIAEPGDKRAIVIRSLQLLAGKLVAAGTATPVEPAPKQPARLTE
ncbi:hypothetical protein [Anatilimnocola floriformis]|uniref:hypothetical protein n=1 Tax=Anatilimnocola floriformis TaxID=2948575 RepID=UPI0020C41C1F|nr:hypothetical protein [Anatilimnocola floriformis]